MKVSRPGACYHRFGGHCRSCPLLQSPPPLPPLPPPQPCWTQLRVLRWATLRSSPPRAAPHLQLFLGAQLRSALDKAQDPGVDCPHRCLTPPPPPLRGCCAQVRRGGEREQRCGASRRGSSDRGAGGGGGVEDCVVLCPEGGGVTFAGFRPFSDHWNTCHLLITHQLHGTCQGCRRRSPWPRQSQQTPWR